MTNYLKKQNLYIKKIIYVAIYEKLISSNYKIKLYLYSQFTMIIWIASYPKSGNTYNEIKDLSWLHIIFTYINGEFDLKRS